MRRVIWGAVLLGVASGDLSPALATAGACSTAGHGVEGDCADDRAGPTVGHPMPPEGPEVVAKLRQYCGACHGLGQSRFLYPDDQQSWTAMFETIAPASREIWAERIVKVLNWPGDTPPPFNQLMDPANSRDWMPKGIKRTQLAGDVTRDRPTRSFILDVLRGADVASPGATPGDSLLQPW